MLQTLRVRNLGAVDELVLDLDVGLTVLTGETGAGKTLLIEALHLVLGGRDRALPARDPLAPGRVEALFTRGATGEVVVARELGTNGRLRATVDGTTVAAAQLAELAEGLCQLQGQHEHLVLRSPDAARVVLDRSAGIDDSELRRLREAVRDLSAQRARLGGSEHERAERLELAEHEAGEIDAVAPEDADELTRRLQEVATVADVLEARAALARAIEALDSDDGPSAASLSTGALAEIPRSLAARRDELSGVVEAIRGVAAALRRDLEGAEGDPDRLDALNGRVSRLQDLVRKHGRSLLDVLARREALAVELAALRDAEAGAAIVERSLAEASASLSAEEARVLGLRERAAVALGGAVRGQLAPLALEHARFEVHVDGAAGDKVRFLFSGSASFEPSALADAASGGELSRVLLALTLASDAGAPTMVFDEVDAGVGGTTARALAACLAEVARHRQVLVVTHLATVAAVADHHLVVERSEDPVGPASVRAVRGDERVAEIARMLAGDPQDPVAIAHAGALLAGDHAEA